MYSLEITNVQVSLQKKLILKDITLKLPPCKILCLLGENGSGKSTLLRSILGLLPYKGSLKIHGQECQELSNHKRAKLLSYVPQIQSVPFAFSLFEVVLMGRFNKSVGFNYSSFDKQCAKNALEMLEIGHLANRGFNELSGGQKQLGLIARALVQDSSILVLDEPVSALDMSHSYKLLHLLKHLEDKTILLTSHHPEQCFIADFVALLQEGRILAFGTPSTTLTSQNINTLYHIQCKEVSLSNGAKYFYPVL